MPMCLYRSGWGAVATAQPSPLDATGFFQKCKVTVPKDEGEDCEEEGDDHVEICRDKPDVEPEYPYYSEYGYYTCLLYTSPSPRDDT